MTRIGRWDCEGCDWMNLDTARECAGCGEPKSTALMSRSGALAECERLREHLDARAASREQWMARYWHLREHLDALAAAATEYQEAVRLAGAYPGHEDHVESEFVEIHGRLDDADAKLADRVDALRRLAGAGPDQPQECVCAGPSMRSCPVHQPPAAVREQEA